MAVTASSGAYGWAKPASAGEVLAMPKGKPDSVEVVDTPDGRFVIANYSDGSVVRKLVDPNERPRRKPRKPVTRAKAASWDKTRKKQI
jgi:hypothetical protein